MHIIPLADIGLILGSALFCLLAFQRIKVPEIVGFLITGLIIGPHGLGWASESATITTIAELGVVLLLFTLGLEFSLGHILTMKRLVFLGGALQFGLTVLLSSMVLWSLDHPLNESVFLGCLFALSSTAIVLKMLEKNQLISGPVGSMSVAILLFQDLAIVPLILLIPFLGPAAGLSLSDQLLSLTRNVFILAMALVALHRFVLPLVLKRVAATRSQEIFIIAVFTLCIGCAWGSNELGMSMALGGFMAGLLLAESAYGYQAFNTVHAFKELFSGFFFVSIGMLLDLGHVWQNLSSVAGYIGIIVLINVTAAALAVRLLGYPTGFALTVALILSQIGEFSFVLMGLGVGHGVVTAATAKDFIAAGVITMVVGPYVIARSGWVSEAMLKLFRRYPPPVHTPDDDSPITEIKDHLVIIGYGVNGRNLAQAARTASIPYRIIEMNPAVVAKEKANGEAIFFGDASYLHILEKASFKTARVICIAISDAFATRKIVDTISKNAPVAQLIVRSRQVAEVDALVKLGAHQVIPEEFETSLEIFRRVLNCYSVPQQTISSLTEGFRQSQYDKMVHAE